MWNLVGYVGSGCAADFLIEGLHRLEYRGYDSAGIAVQNGGEIGVRKRVGRVSELERLLESNPVSGDCGIGHTRWATHGETSDVNSHPHIGGNGEVVIVHNGVIENYAKLRGQLQTLGYVFRTTTDSEIIAHMVCHQWYELIKLGHDPESAETCQAAVERSLTRFKGTYGIVAMFREAPGILVAARVGSPLGIGVGRDEYFLASDASPLVGHTEDVVYLSDNEIAVITADGMEVHHRDTGRQEVSIQTLQQEAADTDLGDFEHYMLKEIFEQPESIENCLRGRIDDDAATAMFGGLNLNPMQLRKIDRIVLTACGTSWHAGLVGEYLLEEFARIPTEVEYASELRYRNPPMTESTMVFAITQSGETADTLAALRECKRKGHQTLAICNVVGSTIAREASGGIYLHAGPEIGVASTKAFTSQVTALTLLALYFGRMRHLSYHAGKRMIRQLREMPDIIRRTLQCLRRGEGRRRTVLRLPELPLPQQLYNFLLLWKVH